MKELLEANERTKESAWVDLEARLNKLAGALKINRKDLFGILYVLVVFREREGKEISFSQIVSDPESWESINTSDNSLLHEVFSNPIKRWGEEAFLEIYSFLGNVEKSLFNQDFPLIFDRLLYEYAENLSKYQGLISTPLELSQLMVQIVSLPDNSKIYNPFGGIASFGIFSDKKQKYIGQEKDHQTWALGLLRLIAHKNGSNKSLILGDSIEDWNPTKEKFDLIISNPPSHLKTKQTIATRFGNTSMAEVILFENSLDSLKEGGKLVALLPSVIFQSQTEIFRNLRDFLVKNDLIESIITLPHKIYKEGIRESMCVMVLNSSKRKKEKVRFINAHRLSNSENGILNVNKILSLLKEDENTVIAKWISNSRILAKGSDLSLGRYFIDKEGTPLKELLLEVRRRTFRGTLINQEGKVILSDKLKDDQLDFRLTAADCEITKIPEPAFSLSESCLLINRVGYKLKPTIFTYTGIPVYISRNVIPFRINTDLVLTEYLIYQLYAEKYLNQKANFPPSLSLKKLNFLDIKIDLPSLGEQKEILSEIRLNWIKREEKRFEEIRKSYGVDRADQNSYLRHSIAGSSSNARVMFSSLKQILEENSSQFPGLLQFKKSPLSKLCVENYLEIIERDLNSIKSALERTGGEIRIELRKEEKIDIERFVKKYVEELRENNRDHFRVKFFNLNHHLIETFDDRNTKVFIQGDRSLIREIFDNLVQNARKHGFNSDDSEENNLEINMKFNVEEFEVQIDFANNGNPFPENFSFEEFKRKGSRVGNEEGDGFGGWYIDQVMKAHKGRLDVYGQREGELLNSDILSTFKLHFPIQTEL